MALDWIAAGSQVLSAAVAKPPVNNTSRADSGIGYLSIAPDGGTWNVATGSATASASQTPWGWIALAAVGAWLLWK